MEYSDNGVLVIGYGLSGKAVAKKVIAQGRKAYIYDQKSGYLTESEIKELISGNKISLAVISPGVPLDIELVGFLKSHGINVISELEYGASFLSCDIVAVTGTNGKTTTVTLLSKMLKEEGKESALCGNIGFPITAIKQKSDFVAVVECSSFQLEGISGFKPKIAAILNLSPDHLDRHKTKESYFMAKKRIYENQDEKDFLVLPDGLKNECGGRSKRYYFSQTEKTNGAHLEKNNIVFGNGDYITGLSNLKIVGRHNVDNVLAAVTMAKLLKVQNTYIERAISSFYGVPHRIAFVKEIDKVRYYNDSKGTNVSSTLVAIEAMQGDTVLILGGKEKGVDYDELFSSDMSKIKAVVVFGENADRVLESAERCGYKAIWRANSLKECVLLSRYLIKSGNVLLSPATSSFDMFSSYEERGERFEEIVRSL